MANCQIVIINSNREINCFFLQISLWRGYAGQLFLFYINFIVGPRLKTYPQRGPPKMTSSASNPQTKPPTSSMISHCIVNICQEQYRNERSHLLVTNSGKKTIRLGTWWWFGEQNAKRHCYEKCQFTWRLVALTGGVQSPLVDEFAKSNNPLGEFNPNKSLMDIVSPGTDKLRYLRTKSPIKNYH